MVLLRLYGPFTIDLGQGFDNSSRITDENGYCCGGKIEYLGTDLTFIGKKLDFTSFLWSYM